MGGNGHKGSRTDVNRCNKHEWAQKYPLVSKFLRNQGVLAVLARKGTAIPSSANKKRDSLSTVSLVGEAGLEGFSWNPGLHRYPQRFPVSPSPPPTTRRTNGEKALSQSLRNAVVIPPFVRWVFNFSSHLFFCLGCDNLANSIATTHSLCIAQRTNVIDKSLQRCYAINK